MQICTYRYHVIDTARSFHFPTFYWFGMAGGEHILPVKATGGIFEWERRDDGRRGVVRVRQYYGAYTHASLSNWVSLQGFHKRCLKTTLCYFSLTYSIYRHFQPVQPLLMHPVILFRHRSCSSSRHEKRRRAASTLFLPLMSNQFGRPTRHRATPVCACV